MFTHIDKNGKVISITTRNAPPAGTVLTIDKQPASFGMIYDFERGEFIDAEKAPAKKAPAKKAPAKKAPAKKAPAKKAPAKRKKATRKKGA